MPTDASQTPIRDGLLTPGPEITEYGLYCTSPDGQEYWVPCRSRIEWKTMGDYWTALGWTCQRVTRTHRKPAWEGLT